MTRYIIKRKGHDPEFSGVSGMTFDTAAEAEWAAREAYKNDKRNMGSNGPMSWLEIAPIDVCYPNAVCTPGAS